MKGRESSSHSIPHCTPACTVTMAPNKRRTSSGGGVGSSCKTSLSSTSTTENGSSIKKKKNAKKKSVWVWGGGASTSSKKKKKKKKAGGTHVTTSTMQAAGVLVLAIITAMAWNSSLYSSSNNEHPPPHGVADPVVKEFLTKFFNHHAEEEEEENTYCNQLLVPTRRTQKAIREISERQRVVQVPRSMILLDLDALRDTFIQQEFFFKDDASTSAAAAAASQQRRPPPPPLDADAYLAAHLARIQQNESNSTASVHPLLLDHLQNVMPSYDDFVQSHPLLWSQEDMQELFGMYSSTNQVVTFVRQSIENEYQQLIAASKSFAQQVSWKEYVRARLCVMTRSFGTGPLQANEGSKDKNKNMTLAEELVYYRQKLGVHLEQGSHALVPVLDLYNHHATPTVGYQYDNAKRAFVISSLGIPAGHEVFDSYGKHTDVHLFARYGFVSADGSELSESNLALWHDAYEDSNHHPEYMHPDRVVARAKRMLRYLQFDDGYTECVTPHHVHQDDAHQLKILKIIRLMQFAHSPTHFTFILGPRRKHATTPSASHVLSSGMTDLSDHVQGDSRFDANAIFGTCRLLSLTHRDYNGSATSLLRQNLYNKSWVLPMTRDALEFRTILCVTRLARQALSRFQTTVKEQKQVVLAQEFQSREWSAAHLRLAEMQNLEFLVKVAFGALQKFDADLLNSEEQYFMRDEPCPPEVAIVPYLEHIMQPPPSVEASGDTTEAETDEAG